MKKSRINILLIKQKSLELLKNSQIPFKLAYYIQGVDYKTDEKIIVYLVGCSEHYLRVKGYYKRHKDIEREYNKQIEEGLKNL